MENKLWRITIDTNPEDCNLNCIMCEEHSKYSNYINHLKQETGVSKRRMPLEWLEPIFKQASELEVEEIIPTTMGDPLVSKHFDVICELTNKYKLRLNVTHNGTFPGKRAIEWAKQIVPITNDIKISWNGATAATAESIMTGLNFEKANDDLLKFIEFRNQYFEENGVYCSVTLQLTFMKSNMHELNQIIEYAASVGVDRIKGHHLWTHFDEIKNESFTSDSNSIEQWNKIVLEAKQKLLKVNTGKKHKLKLDGVSILNDKRQNAVPESHNCPFLGKELWISATGKISPCCAPDKQRNTLGDFGNIKRNNIAETITSTQYQSLVRNYKKHPLCIKCNMRKNN